MQYGVAPTKIISNDSRLFGDERFVQDQEIQIQISFYLFLSEWAEFR